MRELLFLAHRIPYPPDKGDKIRSFHILQYLSSRFDIHLGCFSDEKIESQQLQRLNALCKEVFCLPLGAVHRMSRVSRAFATDLSISEASYRDPRMSAWVDTAIAGGGINDAFVFCSAMFPYVAKHVQHLNTIVDMVDVDSQKWGDYAQAAPWPMRAVYRREQRRLFALEKRAAGAAACCLLVSAAEAALFRKLAPECASAVRHLDNGVDLERFDPTLVFSDPFPSGSSPIVFTGMMDYRPNIDAVVWFAREAMPVLRRTHKNAEFWIVGKNPAAAVRRLRKLLGIRVVGAVSDVRPYLANARCVVAPLRIARGVQNKVLEAMAMAKPIVLTPAALEGVGAVPERDLLVATGADEFARLVSQVLSGIWRELGSSAQAFVEREHCWKENLPLLEIVFANDSRMPAHRRRTASMADD